MKRFILALILIVTLVPALAFSHCEEIREKEAYYRKECDSVGGHDSTRGKIHDECHLHTRYQQALALCEDYHQDEAIQKQRVLKVTEEANRLKAKDKKRKQKVKNTCIHIDHVSDLYFSQIEQTECNLEESFLKLKFDFESLGLDLAAPEVEAEFRRQAKVIEKRCTSQLLKKMIGSKK